MTSTVLDVTVLLLCVSASVVALGAADDDRGAAGPEAAEVADLIATETVTVTYGSDEAPNGTRTVHATHAELLALMAAETDGGGEKHASEEAFESKALAAIERGIGPRTRIDAEAETGGPDRPGNESGGGSETPSTIGSSRWGSNGSATPTGPRGWQFGSDGTDRGPAVTTGTGVPWRIDREQSSDGGSGTQGRETESESPDPIAIGSEPPRSADVTVAVITHPAPNAADSPGPIRIVIRRW